MKITTLVMKKYVRAFGTLQSIARIIIKYPSIITNCIWHAKNKYVTESGNFQKSVKVFEESITS